MELRKVTNERRFKFYKRIETSMRNNFSNTNISDSLSVNRHYNTSRATIITMFTEINALPDSKI